MIHNKRNIKNHKIFIGSIICIIVVGLSIITSCVNNSKITILKFNLDEISNHEIKLISDVETNTLYFKDDSTVTVTTGKKNNYLTGPIYLWKIDDDSNLQIYSDNVILSLLKKISLKNNVLCVYENNEVRNYDYIKK